MDELTLDMIEEITRNDGTRYYEIGNMIHNGRAELAAEKGIIKMVRIIQLNIPHSQNVAQYEAYILSEYGPQDDMVAEWSEWAKTSEIEPVFSKILAENHIG